MHIAYAVGRANVLFVSEDSTADHLLWDCKCEWLAIFFVYQHIGIRHWIYNIFISGTIMSYGKHLQERDYLITFDATTV